ncbi:MAG: hypothetical protein J6128_04930 [Clostridia bacterium]|nr:hypothetical protein [Clostridia bacterium]
MKRIIGLIIVISILMSVLSACSGGEGDGGTTSKPDGSSADTTTGSAGLITADVDPIDPALEALDYENKTFVILSRGSAEQNDKDFWAENELWVDELTNDPVSDAVYNRNAFVCETLGLKEIKNEVAGATAITEKVGVMVNSGDQTYDLVAASIYYGSPMITQGLMYNLRSNDIDTYLNPENPWWAQYWISQADMGDRLYCITGAPALSLTRLMFVMYYNKDLGQKLKLENLYEVVEEGRWTIDYLSELIPSLYLSLNGDDVRDSEDQYGLAINHYENADMFWSSFDMSMITKDEDGWFEMDNSQKERISVAFEKVYSLIHENVGTYDTGDTSGFDIARDMFASGTVLLAALHLKYAESQQFRNMQDEYGIIPGPKLDETQKDYYTYAHDQYSVFMIPITVADPEMSGAVLETMAYESYRSLQPVYYDMVLKGRYANDPESRRMLDIITTNFKMDPGWIYGALLELPCAHVFRSLIYGEEKTFASSYAKVEKKLPALLKIMKQNILKFDF